MSVKGKLLFLISAVAGIILISLLMNNMNTQLIKTADTPNEATQAQPQPIVNQERLAAMAGQVVPLKKEAITIIGAVPVEHRVASVSVAEEKKEASVFKSQNNPVSSSSSLKSSKQEDIPVAPSSGITVNKEPTETERKGMSSKGTIIF